jgi:formylmethanofuran dehydrogenase subunit C
MSPLVFTLRTQPPQRVDLTPLTPHRVAGLRRRDIEHLSLATTRAPLTVGDLFRLRGDDPARLIIEGGSTRFDRLGSEMNSGTLRLDGDAGIEAGRRMRGGTLTIAGNTGPFAASGLRGGTIEILGHAGDCLGGPRSGEIEGMNGGVVIVRGTAAHRAGDRMRRGLIVIEGSAGDAAASRMIAGTLVVCGAVGAHPGLLMRRGTLLIGGTATLLPSFVPTGAADPVFHRLLARALRPFSPRASRLATQPGPRYAGDMATIGKGEVLLAL